MAKGKKKKGGKGGNQAAKKEREPEQEPEEELEDEEEHEAVTEVPEFYDEDGVLKRLKGSDFPKSTEGRMAHCDYQIEVIKAKKAKIAERDDPQAKLKRKLERYKKLISDLEDELAGDDDEDAGDEE